MYLLCAAHDGLVRKGAANNSPAEQNKGEPHPVNDVGQGLALVGSNGGAGLPHELIPGWHTEEHTTNQAATHPAALETMR